jgi:outer membrane protein assembly factor BamB
VRGTSQYLSEDAARVYLRADNNQIVAVSKASGQELFRSHRTDMKLFATNLKPDGMVYAATLDGDVYAIRPVTTAGTVGELARAFGAGFGSVTPRPIE